MLFPKEQYFQSSYLKVGLKRRSIKSASVTLISQLIGSVIKVVGAIILARILVPDDFGLLSMTATFILLLQNFGVNGFTEAIVQKENISHRQVSSLFWINMSVSFALAAILVSLSPLVASFYKDNRLVAIINVMSISILMGGLSTPHMALLQRNMKFTRIAAIRLMAALISVVIGITLANQDFGYWALVARRLSLPTIIAIGSWLLCTWLPGAPKFSNQVKKLFFFGIFTYGNFLMNYLRMNFDKILIGRVLGSEPLGYYDRAYHLANQIPQQMTVPISGVFISALSRLHNEPARYKRYIKKLLSTVGLFCMPASMLLSLIGQDFIVLLLGTHWHEAGKVFTALGPGIGMLVIYNIHAWMHISLGNAKRLFCWGILSLFVTIILFSFGIKYGSIGIGIAYSTAFFVLTLPALWYAGKPIEIELIFYVRCLWRPFLAALIAGLFQHYILSNFLSQIPFFFALEDFGKICTTVFFFILFYVILIILFWGQKPFTDILSIIAEIAPNKFNRTVSDSRRK
jgi:PST family polysaccharide transporter